MRYVFSATAAVIAFVLLAPSIAFGQAGLTDLSITNYQFVNEQRVTRTQFYVTYRADLVNRGVAAPAAPPPPTPTTRPPGAGGGARLTAPQFPLPSPRCRVKGGRPPAAPPPPPPRRAGAGGGGAGGGTPPI